MDIVAQDRQTLLDIQLITSGSIEGIMELCELNNLSLTTDLEDGQVITTRPIINSKIVKAYANQKISPATAVTDAELKKILGEDLLGGIGYWAIEVDFKIQ